MGSPDSPTPDYTEQFDLARAEEIDFVDVENLSEGDYILSAKCFVCNKNVSEVTLSACQHKNCYNYICKECLTIKIIKRGMKCKSCPARFWLGRNKWSKCRKCFSIRCPSCKRQPCSHAERHIFD